MFLPYTVINLGNFPHQLLRKIPHFRVKILFPNKLGNFPSKKWINSKKVGNIPQKFSE